MSGSGDSDSNPKAEIRLKRIEDVLDRRVDVPSLAELQRAMARDADTDLPEGPIAIGLDANVLLRLNSLVDVIDFLNLRHDGPLILPGQTVQEYWNNYLSVIETTASGLRKKFDDLVKAVGDLDASLVDFADRGRELLDAFQDEYGYIYAEATIRNITETIAMLMNRAAVVYIPRDRFLQIGELRWKTRTPPGFKDDRSGDFFVWIEYLFGLMEAQDAGVEFRMAVMVTKDEKIDWSRNKIAHPILAAEVRALLDVPFEIWDLEKLQRFVAAQLSE